MVEWQNLSQRKDFGKKMMEITRMRRNCIEKSQYIDGEWLCVAIYKPFKNFYATWSQTHVYFELCYSKTVEI